MNVHFSPGMHPKARNTAVKESAQFLLREKCSAQILQGDITIDDTKSWFRQARKERKPWSGLVCPYESGSPTNRVKKGYRNALTVRDWMLISTSTPCKKCEWVIVPRLSSNFALLFELHFDAQYLRPADPTCSQFNFRPTSEAALAQAAALVSAGLLWCTAAQWRPDAVLFSYWDLIRQCVRKRVSIHSVTEEAAKVAAAARGQQQGIEASV